MCTFLYVELCTYIYSFIVNDGTPAEFGGKQQDSVQVRGIIKVRESGLPAVRMLMNGWRKQACAEANYALLIRYDFSFLQSSFPDLSDTGKYTHWHDHNKLGSIFQVTKTRFKYYLVLMK